MIIYFSGTGNSRYAAESLALLLDDTLISANNYIKNAVSAEFTSDTPYIFVSPTYAWRIPRVFSDFIESGRFGGSRDVYFVMTCGTDIGNADGFLRPFCEKRGFYYKGVAELPMPENYIAMFSVTAESEVAALIAQADKLISDISKAVLAGAPLPKSQANLLDRLKSGPFNPLFYSLLVNAKGFRVTDKCIGCGKCEELCPLNNIKLTDGTPAYGDRCTHCMACISACPTEAIEYKRKSVGQPRYYNTLSPEQK